MFWERCNIDFFDTSSGEIAKVSGYETINNQEYWVYITKESFDKLLSGIPLNLALAGSPLDIKEFLISGIAPSKKSIFSFQRSVLLTAFVTNAVARSIAFYAMSYLNNKGLSVKEIQALKEKYSITSVEKNYFTIEELKLSFEKQSIFFLNVYNEMNNNNKFQSWVMDLERQNKFKNVFRNYENSISLIEIYNRRIFHDKLECEFMRSDYVEEKFRPNTGVFAEDTVNKKLLYYSINKSYLEKLDMRICKKCSSE